MLECVKYARDRNEMMQVVLRELGDARVEKTGREWMVLLLGLCEDTRAVDTKACLRRKPETPV
ncbi:hypothetical protein E2C01_059088 [Portunus trituberculatus]|uniref:Uncharacterized protein n=1 Tax=Portunus trituberculatus TaxID=210409 RepID=A0A5B7H4W4_PORTR|nr:hypothetical protein [Portunus trituberculatus]